MSEFEGECEEKAKVKRSYSNPRSLWPSVPRTGLFQIIHILLRGAKNRVTVGLSVRIFSSSTPKKKQCECEFACEKE